MGSPSKEGRVLCYPLKNDAYACRLIEQANRKEKEGFSRSLGRLKNALLNVVVIGLLSVAVLLAILHVHP